jgi:hypothetical protein
MKPLGDGADTLDFRKAGIQNPCYGLDFLQFWSIMVAALHFRQRRAFSALFSFLALLNALLRPFFTYSYELLPIVS